MISTKDYLDRQIISDRILYLAAMFDGAKEHLKLLEEADDYKSLDFHLFNVMNDLEIAINELYEIYDQLVQIELKHQ